MDSSVRKRLLLKSLTKRSRGKEVAIISRLTHVEENSLHSHTWHVIYARKTRIVRGSLVFIARSRIIPYFYSTNYSDQQYQHGMRTRHTVARDDIYSFHGKDHYFLIM